MAFYINSTKVFDDDGHFDYALDWGQYSEQTYVYRSDGIGYYDFKNSTGEDYDCRFQGDGARGLYWWVGGGSHVMRMLENGDVGIGVGPIVNTRLVVRGTGSTSASTCVYVQNSSSVELVSWLDDGRTRWNLGQWYGANAHVASDGIMYRSTSSRRYKRDIQDAIHGLDEVLKLRSVTYKHVNNKDKIFGGLIAEEVHELGLTEFVEYDKEGNPDAIYYNNMISLIAKAIQELYEDFREINKMIEDR